MASKPEMPTPLKKITVNVERKQRSAPKFKSYTDLGSSNSNFSDSCAAQGSMKTIPSKPSTASNGGNQQFKKQTGRQGAL